MANKDISQTINPHCRIGRVRFHSGGELYLLPDPSAPRHEALIGELRGMVDRLEDDPDWRFAGFAIVCWNCAGGNISWVRTYEGCPISNTEAPDAARAALQRHLWLGDMREQHED